MRPSPTCTWPFPPLITDPTHRPRKALRGDRATGLAPATMASVRLCSTRQADPRRPNGSPHTANSGHLGTDPPLPLSVNESAQQPPRRSQPADPSPPKGSTTGPSGGAEDQRTPLLNPTRPDPAAPNGSPRTASRRPSARHQTVPNRRIGSTPIPGSPRRGRPAAAPSAPAPPIPALPRGSPTGLSRAAGRQRTTLRNRPQPIPLTPTESPRTQAPPALTAPQPAGPIRHGGPAPPQPQPIPPLLKDPHILPAQAPTRPPSSHLGSPVHPVRPIPSLPMDPRAAPAQAPTRPTQAPPEKPAPPRPADPLPTKGTPLRPPASNETPRSSP